MDELAAPLIIALPRLLRRLASGADRRRLREAISAVLLQSVGRFAIACFDVLVSHALTAGEKEMTALADHIAREGSSSPFFAAVAHAVSAAALGVPLLPGDIAGILRLSAKVTHSVIADFVAKCVTQVIDAIEEGAKVLATETSQALDKFVHWKQSYDHICNNINGSLSDLAARLRGFVDDVIGGIRGAGENAIKQLTGSLPGKLQSALIKLYKGHFDAAVVPLLAPVCSGILNNVARLVANDLVTQLASVPSGADDLRRFVVRQVHGAEAFDVHLDLSFEVLGTTIIDLGTVRLSAEKILKTIADAILDRFGSDFDGVALKFVARQAAAAKLALATAALHGVQESLNKTRHVLQGIESEYCTDLVILDEYGNITSDGWTLANSQILDVCLAGCTLDVAREVSGIPPRVHISLNGQELDVSAECWREQEHLWKHTIGWRSRSSHGETGPLKDVASKHVPPMPFDPSILIPHPKPPRPKPPWPSPFPGPSGPTGSNPRDEPWGPSGLIVDIPHPLPSPPDHHGSTEEIEEGPRGIRLRLRLIAAKRAQPPDAIQALPQHKVLRHAMSALARVSNDGHVEVFEPGEPSVSLVSGPPAGAIRIRDIAGAHGAKDAEPVTAVVQSRISRRPNRSER